MNNEMDLFKQAIREALDKKIDEAINSENEEINVSKKHKIAMRTILRGKIPAEGGVSTKKVRIIAIVAIIALLLASCAVIYREEIGKLRVKILERYDLITHSDNSGTPLSIEEEYELSYVPEGYELKDVISSEHDVLRTYYNATGKNITLCQSVVGNSHILLDNEHGNSETYKIGDLTIYYRPGSDKFVYLWNDEKYIVIISSDIKFSIDELTKIIEGVKII